MNTAICRLVTLTVLVSVHCLFAQEERPGEFEAVEWIRNTPEDGFDFSWTGKPDRYYFVEQSPDLSANSWSLFPYATKGDGSEAGIFLTRSANKYFFRLRYTDETAYPLLLEDFNESGFSNRDELDIGGNPFDDTDTNHNGVPDHIEAFWANEVPESWKLTLADDPNKAFYDPDNAVTGPSDVLPGDDYDGDGRSNLREYLDGTDPTDFFNGALPVLTNVGGDGQTQAPQSWLEKQFFIKVQNTNGQSYLNAPVKFTVNGGHVGLSANQNTSLLTSTLHRRTQSYGTGVCFFTPNIASGNRIDVVTASLPTGQSVSFTVTTDIDFITPPTPPYDFQMKDNGVDTTTYTWRSNHGTGDFSVQGEQPEHSGNWVLLFTVPYASLSEPLDENRYTVTVDENYNVVP